MPRIDLEAGWVDPERRIVVVEGKEARLSTKEAEVLTYLLSKAGRSVSRDELYQKVWGGHALGEGRAVDKAVRRLRLRVERDPTEPVHVLTDHGEGYRFVPRAADPAPRPSSPLPPRRGAFVAADRILHVERVLDERPLIVLWGPGGVGKTRLALEVAHRSERRVVWIADVGPTPATAVLAAVLGPRTDRISTDPSAEVVQVLGRTGPVLLVLDAVEAAATAVAELVEAWTTRLPDLKVIVCSREPLGAAHLVPVEPLSEADAVLLWEGRTGRAEAGADVRALVNALDRLPLALELAAAHTPLLGARQLLDRLDHRFALLRRPGQSLDAALRWSTERLDREAWMALAQLSTFRAPFDLELVDATLEGGPIEALTSLETLARASLVQVDTTAPEARYTILQSIRELVWSEVPSAERQRLTERHAHAVVGHVHRLLHRLDAGGSAGLQDRLAERRPDLQVALAVDEDPLLHARCVLALLDVGWAPLAASMDPLERALGRVTDLRTRAELLRARGSNRLRLGLDGALEDLDAAVAKLESMDEPAALGRALANRGVALSRYGRGDPLADFERALAAHTQAGMARRRGIVLCHIGVTLRTIDPVRAGDALLEAADLARSYGDRRQLTFTLILLAELARSRGDLDRARTLEDDAVQVAQTDPTLDGSVLLNLGLLLHARGDVEPAFAFLERALVRCEDDLRAEGQIRATLALAAFDRGDLDRAALELGRGLRLLRDDRANTALYTAHQAHLLTVRGYDKEARALWSEQVEPLLLSMDPDRREAIRWCGTALGGERPRDPPAGVATRIAARIVRRYLDASAAASDEAVPTDSHS